MAAAAPSPSKVLSLKLLIDKEANKVVFAEAGKETVDFLCSILTLPVGTVTRLLSEQGMVGSLSNLYQSIQNLNDDFVHPGQHKDTVLKPIVLGSAESTPLFANTDVPTRRTVTEILYMCPNNMSHHYVTNVRGTKCTSCNNVSMSYGVNFVVGDVVGATNGGTGFVKGSVMYMVMDDLVVAPTSAIEGLTLVTKLNVNVTSLEQKVVGLDMAKGLKLLKASFQTKNVLTEVFLRGSSVKAEAKIDFSKIQIGSSVKTEGFTNFLSC